MHQTHICKKGVIFCYLFNNFLCISMMYGCIFIAVFILVQILLVQFQCSYCVVKISRKAVCLFHDILILSFFLLKSGLSSVIIPFAITTAIHKHDIPHGQCFCVTNQFSVIFIISLLFVNYTILSIYNDILMVLNDNAF